MQNITKIIGKGTLNQYFKSYEKNNFIINHFLLNLISNVYADKCYDSDTTPVILDSDKKPGRYFEDQPDVNDDF